MGRGKYQFPGKVLLQKKRYSSRVAYFESCVRSVGNQSTKHSEGVTYCDTLEKKLRGEKRVPWLIRAHARFRLFWLPTPIYYHCLRTYSTIIYLDLRVFILK